MEWILRVGYRVARRIVVGVVGGSLVLIGLAMVFLPGPALVVIPLGLAILGIEFAWARRWLRKVKEAAREASSRIPGNEERSPEEPPGREADGSSEASSRAPATRESR